MLPFAQVLHSLLRLLKGKDFVDMRPDLIRLYESEHVFVQLFRSDVDPAMYVTSNIIVSMLSRAKSMVWYGTGYGTVREHRGERDLP